MRITVETQVKAPLAVVWQAYIDPRAIEQWNVASPDWQARDARVDLRVGGHFSCRMEAKDGSAGFDFEGVYTKIVPERHLAYAFGERQASVDFIAEGQNVTVRVQFDAENLYPLEQQRAGWKSILDCFAQYVEGSLNS